MRPTLLALSLALTACGDKGDDPADTGSLSGTGDDGANDTGEDCTAETWYADADGDGFGDPAAPTEACEPPEGHVDNAEDCDGADNDCDGEIDFGRRVPDDHATIQAAIDALDADDPICIQAGTHAETLDLGGTDHVLWGAGGAPSCSRAAATPTSWSR